MCLSSGQGELVFEQPTPSGTLEPVLVAGADADTRSSMARELQNLLPANTPFVETCETWELLDRAATSRLVILTDHLGGISTGSVVRLLGRRYPTLPVLVVDRQSAMTAPRADDDMASV
jgi:hypothetical protein